MKQVHFILLSQPKRFLLFHLDFPPVRLGIQRGEISVKFSSPPTSEENNSNGIRKAHSRVCRIHWLGFIPTFRFRPVRTPRKL
jgi:hypothetical protein